MIPMVIKNWIRRQYAYACGRPYIYSQQMKVWYVVDEHLPFTRWYLPSGSPGILIIVDDDPYDGVSCQLQNIKERKAEIDRALAEGTLTEPSPYSQSSSSEEEEPPLTDSESIQDLGVYDIPRHLYPSRHHRIPKGW